MIIKVRGGGSITGDNSPLYIIDGFPVSSIGDIAPSDIEDITVLKDAASTAIYGSQGANGVILVTTKGAKSGKTVVSYNGYVQGKSIAKTLDTMTPYQYVMYNYERAALRGTSDISSFESVSVLSETSTCISISRGMTGRTRCSAITISHSLTT